MTGASATASADVTKADPSPSGKTDIRNNPTLDLTAIRVNVEPKGPDLPFPEKDIGLEL